MNSLCPMQPTAIKCNIEHLQRNLKYLTSYFRIHHHFHAFISNHVGSTQQIFYFRTSFSITRHLNSHVFSAWAAGTVQTRYCGPGQQQSDIAFRSTELSAEREASIDDFPCTPKKSSYILSCNYYLLHSPSSFLSSSSTLHPHSHRSELTNVIVYNFSANKRRTPRLCTAETRISRLQEREVVAEDGNIGTLQRGLYRRGRQGREEHAYQVTHATLYSEQMDPQFPKASIFFFYINKAVEFFCLISGTTGSN